MITSFGNQQTSLVWSGRVARKLPRAIQEGALSKLIILHLTQTIAMLRIPPGNRLGKLRGDREGQWSIRVNDQWRICFTFVETTENDEAQASEVEIVDYH